MGCSMPGFPVLTICRSLLKLMPIESVMSSSPLILVVPFSSWLQSFPPSESLLMSYIFTLVHHIIGAWASVLPVNIQGWFPLGLTGLISLLSKGLKSLLQHHSSKASILRCAAFFMVRLSHPFMTTFKTIALTRQTFVRKVMSLLFHMLSRFVIAFRPRSKSLLISWLQSPSSVILEPKGKKKTKKQKTLSLFPLSPHLFTMKWWDQMPWSFFLNVEF